MFKIECVCIVADNENSVFKGFGGSDRAAKYAKTAAFKQVYEKIIQKLKNEIESQI